MGILLGVLLLELGLRMGGFIILAHRELTNKVASEKGNEYRILCLGESTTYDGGIYCYPYQLETILNNKNKDIKFKVINNGIPGVQTEAIVGQLENNLDKFRPQMVITMMGINDVGDIIINKIISNPRTDSFYRNLRIYKLAKLIQLNVINMLEKSGIFRENEHIGDNYGSKKPDLISRKISMLKEEINRDPSNSFARLILKQYYNQQGRFKDAEQMYKELIQRNKPGDARIKVYVDLARFYQERERFGEIERMYKEAIKKDPECARLYCELGIYYRDRLRFKEAEIMYKKAIKVSPKNSIIYDNLGDSYKREGRYIEAEEAYKIARLLHPQHINTSYELLGKEFREKGKYSEIVMLYQRILEIDPNDKYAYYNLGKCYEKQGKYFEAEETYKTNIKKFPDNYRGYGILALFYQKQGKSKLAEINFEKAEKMKLESYYSSSLVRNYRKLRETILKRGLKLVCVQYPMWEAGLLKKILGTEEGVIFVDNEKIFKDKVDQFGYDVYFVDRFAGDFGHCTKKGNALLANNIAEAILKSGVFKNKGH